MQTHVAEEEAVSDAQRAGRGRSVTGSSGPESTTSGPV